MGQNSGHNQPVLIILLFLSVVLPAAAGEDTASCEAALFNKGYESYLSYEPEKAVREFNSFLREFPDSSARDAALYWLGKSYTQLKSYGEARRVFTEITEKYQTSPYLSYAEKELEMFGKLDTDVLIDEKPAAGAGKESPEKRLREAEKQVKAMGKSLKEVSEERDRVKAQLSEEKKKTDTLREKVKELEDREQMVSDLIQERDALKSRIEEQKKTDENFIIQTQKAEMQEKPTAVTGAVQKESKMVEGEPQKEQSGGITETAGDILAMLGVQVVPWRTGNSREDEETERLLYEMAKRLNITGETKQLRDLIKLHALDANQQDALKRFLAISEYIDQRLNHMPEQPMIDSLIVRYEEEDRYSKIVIARELQEKAKEGISFEDILNLYPNMIKLKVVPLQQLDRRIREKISSLPYGEIGVLWSEEGYMILKPVRKKLSYDPFQDVSSEMRERITTLVKDWLREVKSQ